jgi:hypothetical protein
METKWCKMHCDMQLYTKQSVITNNVYCVSDINNFPKEQIQIALDNFEKKYNWTQWTIEDAEKRFREKWNLYLIETEDSSIIGWVWVSFEGEVLNAHSNHDFKEYFSDKEDITDIMGAFMMNYSKDLGYKKLFAKIEEWNRPSLEWAIRHTWVYDED